jgi:hypothetical protein
MRNYLTDEKESTMNTLTYLDIYPELQHAIDRSRERNEHLAALADERRVQRRAERRVRIRRLISRTAVAH